MQNLVAGSASSLHPAGEVRGLRPCLVGGSTARPRAPWPRLEGACLRPRGGGKLSPSPSSKPVGGSTPPRSRGSGRTKRRAARRVPRAAVLSPPPPPPRCAAGALYRRPYLRILLLCAARCSSPLSAAMARRCPAHPRRTPRCPPTFRPRRGDPQSGQVAAAAALPTAAAAAGCRTLQRGRRDPARRQRLALSFPPLPVDIPAGCSGGRSSSPATNKNASCESPPPPLSTRWLMWCCTYLSTPRQPAACSPPPALPTATSGASVLARPPTVTHTRWVSVAVGRRGAHREKCWRRSPPARVPRAPHGSPLHGRAEPTRSRRPGADVTSAATRPPRTVCPPL